MEGENIEGRGKQGEVERGKGEVEGDGIDGWEEVEGQVEGGEVDGWRGGGREGRGRG